MIIKKNKQNLRENNIKTNETQISVSNTVDEDNNIQDDTNLKVNQEYQEFDENNLSQLENEGNLPEKSNFKETNEETNKFSEPEIDLFDIENIDFSQREERRRGSRRRGYRRIDDRNLVSRAQEEADMIKKSAFDEGYRLGLEKANEDLENFRANLGTFLGATKEVYEYIAPDILEISVDIAKKIIKKEVEADPQALINIIVDVLKNISKNEPKVNVRVAPQIMQFVKDSLPSATYEYGIEAKINVVADPSLEEGGCIVQTNNGIVDASIKTQIEIIKKALESI